jgi:hypothetical protein
MILAQIETVTSISIISRCDKKQEKGSTNRQSELNLLLVLPHVSAFATTTIRELKIYMKKDNLNRTH